MQKASVAHIVRSLKMCVADASFFGGKNEKDNNLDTLF